MSQRLAAATEHERIHEAATTGARALLPADLCQLFRLEAAGGELRLVASDPPEASGPRPQGGALLLELLARGAPRRRGRGLWPGFEDAALLTTPLECLGRAARPAVRARARPRRFGEGDEELLRALADQTAMGLERADLIARLTARDRVKDLFDALAGGTADDAVLRAAPPGCDLAQPHVVIEGVALPPANGGGADWEAVAARLAARLRGRDQTCFFDAGPRAACARSS